MRVLLLGDCEVGKTSLIRRLTDRLVHPEYRPTEYYAIETITPELEIIEIPGSERNRAFSRQAFADVDRIVIMLAMDDIQSLYTVREWVDQYRRYAKPMTIVVNKRDTFPMAERVNEYGWQFISTQQDSKEILFKLFHA